MNNLNCESYARKEVIRDDGNLICITGNGLVKHWVPRSRVIHRSYGHIIFRLGNEIIQTSGCHIAVNFKLKRNMRCAVKGLLDGW